MQDHRINRRRFLAATLPLLAACTTPLPIVPRPSSDKAAAERLQDSAEAHGYPTYRGIRDISVRYEGQWRPIIDRIQPAVVDASYRGGSEERVLPFQTLVAQSYTGTAGQKHVVWRRGDGRADRPGRIAVWRNGQPDTDPERLRASALVAEGYGLFLLGPLWLTDRGFAVRSAGTERVDGRSCDVVDVWMTPGLGEAALDRVALCIDRQDSVTRRVRFTLEGTEGTRGAVAEVDTFDHERRFGVLWPMRSYERVVHPIRLPAHDWRITGLDVNRGFEAGDVTGQSFTGLAAAPARALA